MVEIVKGWMSEPEIAWLKAHAATRFAIAEVGCWMGTTTRELAAVARGKVFAIDTWQGSAEHQKMLEGLGSDWLYQQFLANVQDCGNIVPVRMPSVKAAACLKDLGTSLEMVFIDAAHDYENVKADILAWRELLGPKGLLCGHDFDAGRTGVVQAVRELVGDIKCGPGSIWYAA
jgi:SAM-dependent methyltransferase